MEKTKRSTFKLLFYLKKNAPKKNGRVSVMGRVTVDGKMAQFSTKLEINPENWDLKFGRVSGKSDEARTINQKLDKLRLLIDKHYLEMMHNEGFVTADKLKIAFLGIGVISDSLLKVFKKHNEDFKKEVDKEEKALNTYIKYEIVYRHLAEFIKERHHRNDMAFRELVPDFIREFDSFLRIDKEFTHNTVWVYTMPVLKMVEMARKKGLIHKNPFEEYSISMKETDRGYFLKEDVEKIMLCKPANKLTELVRDMFIFSCFTGLSYIDIKRLKKSNIQSFFDSHQWIISRRKKSDVTSNVRLLEIPKRIIEKYTGITGSDLIFPMPVNCTCNKHLRKAIAEAGVITETRDSFHKGRHTFGTMLLTEGVPLESLSKMMGHKNIATTQIYAKIVNQKISKDMDLVSKKFEKMEVAFISMEDELVM
ncbi:site-specific integrase [Chryseobacterium viscerum]|uniref:Integrase n=1 Tax=Chryseobacterium viscerum TaxID=1037377 RepID=A0A316WZP8_9FLAO|nr:site-specific integrase [Chryseobacterium viscerum]PWN64100.1 integrase [Chryseobacterium viscerum]